VGMGKALKTRGVAVEIRLMPLGPQPGSDATGPCRQRGAVEQSLGFSEHRCLEVSIEILIRAGFKPPVSHSHAPTDVISGYARWWPTGSPTRQFLSSLVIHLF
jgi:hypothetical protein